MKYIFRGHTVFEYIPDAKYDKVIQHKIENSDIPAFDFCSMIPDDYKLLSNFFDTVYNHIQNKTVILTDIEVY